MISRTKSRWRLPSAQEKPVPYFLVFAVSGGLLSYGGLSTVAWLWILLFGILLPLGLACGMEGKGADRKGRVFSPMTAFDGTGNWLLLLAAVLALGSRFYRLTDLYGWPTKDEGTYLYSAMEILRGGSTPFFYGVAEMPPLFRLLLAGFLECFPPSLFSFKLFPAVVSLATVPVGYWAARRYFPRPASLLLAFLLATGFWPLFLGRFCMALVLTFLLECWVLGLMGSFLKEARLSTGVWLGSVVGVGSYASSPQWAVLVLVVSLAVLNRAADTRPRAWRAAVAYFLSAFLVFLPYLWNILARSYGSHIQELWTARDSLGTLDKLALGGAYLRGLFWGVRTEGFVYGPVWGGFLNPVAGSFFLLGFAGMFRSRGTSVARWLVLSLCLFLVPGLATYDLEMLRILLVLPLVLVVVALGAVSVVASVGGRWKAPVLTALLLFSAGSDFLHSAFVYPRAWSAGGIFAESIRSEESRQAYLILEEQARVAGPGLLFLDFTSVPFDQTLTSAAYPMNALEGSGSGRSKATWAAVLFNRGYEPFLERRLPQGEWHSLNSVSAPWGLKWSIGIIPLVGDDPQTRQTLRQWEEASVVFHRLAVRLISLPTTGKGRTEALEDFLSFHSAAGRDPFLESCFWEVAAFNHSAEKKFGKALVDLELILRDGYPAAHVYNDLGSLLYFSGDPEGARKAFLNADRLGSALTPARENLRLLEEWVK